MAFSVYFGVTLASPKSPLTAQNLYAQHHWEIMNDKQDMKQHFSLIKENCFCHVRNFGSLRS